MTLGAAGALLASSGPQPVKAASSARLTAEKAAAFITLDLTGGAADFPVACMFTLVFSELGHSMNGQPVDRIEITVNLFKCRRRAVVAYSTFDRAITDCFITINEGTRFFRMNYKGCRKSNQGGKECNGFLEVSHVWQSRV
ncbi:hypothetical protein [Pseudomonas fluorescens]|uniref:hypothetical protein n=1 Tax=Pseudomonas fluorescens TaxID=294 RepID=UPI001CD54CE3|nr:hypothetical protein [Pseudomonas fluorescens]